MKILVVCQHYWPENFRVTEICEALASRGHDVTALVGLPNYPSGVIPEEYKRFGNRRQERNGVHIRRCMEIGRKPGKLGLAVNYTSYMLSACHKVLWMKKDYDAIYAFSTSPVLMSLPAALMRAIGGKNLIIYIMDIWPACLAAMNVSEQSLLYRFMRRVSRWIYKRADRLIYSSKRFQGYLAQVHGIAVSDDSYMPQFADGAFEAELPAHTPAEGTQLVFAGNIGRMQSVDTLLRAAALLMDEPIRWHIVGGGASLEECKALADTLHLADAVVFYGQRPLEEMPSFYALADAMLVSLRDDPLVADTLPGKVQTYMAAGKPILGAIGGEAAYVISQANCGMVSAPDNPAAFADTVRAFLACGDQKALGQNGKRYYQENFTKKQHIDRLEKMLTDLSRKG